jgi:ABC-type dipeptide/oligopeptide/nickel transport system permease component
VFNYILRRILISIPMLFIVVTLVFFAFQLIPGDPARLYAGEQAPLELVEQVRQELGLDKPVLVQYVNYLGRLAHGDLGKSFVTRRPVIMEVSSRFLATVKLSVAAIILASIPGVVMGTISAAKQEGPWDYFFSILSLLGISVPVFWLGLMFMTLFSVKLKWLPTSGADGWRNYLMPTVCLAVYSIAFVTRMTRSAVLEVIGEDYVRTARAKGLMEKVVLFRHVVRNALIPVITVVGLQFGYMLGGAVVTETIFAWPGMGRLLVMSVAQRDIPAVQGVLLVFAAAFLVVNLLIDLVYSVLDPRIRYS